MSINPIHAANLQRLDKVLQGKSKSLLMYALNFHSRFDIHSLHTFDKRIPCESRHGKFSFVRGTYTALTMQKKDANEKSLAALKHNDVLLCVDIPVFFPVRNGRINLIAPEHLEQALTGSQKQSLIAERMGENIFIMTEGLGGSVVQVDGVRQGMVFWKPYEAEPQAVAKLLHNRFPAFWKRLCSFSNPISHITRTLSQAANYKHLLEMDMHIFPQETGLDTFLSVGVLAAGASLADKEGVAAAQKQINTENIKQRFIETASRQFDTTWLVPKLAPKLEELAKQAESKKADWKQAVEDLKDLPEFSRLMEAAGKPLERR